MAEDVDTFATRPRRVPQSAHPRPAPAPRPPAAPASPAPHAPRGSRRPPATPHTPPTEDRPITRPDEPIANLAVRVRRSVDDRLAELLHGLRGAGVRTSRAELVEMLLWELPAAPDEALRARLIDFRTRAPRL
ncbi:MAG: hypothetical protein AUI13_07450 [Gemmatimonadetes bacterium 13_2_20CM_2_69_23]|nr:MAG: hypothetical protein AUI13_07450 [Gemmatimonadetes bacterium 13_2_20CM_2_69_23]